MLSMANSQNMFQNTENLADFDAQQRSMLAQKRQGICGPVKSSPNRAERNVLPSTLGVGGGG